MAQGMTAYGLVLPASVEVGRCRALGHRLEAGHEAIGIEGREEVRHLLAEQILLVGIRDLDLIQGKSCSFSTELAADAARGMKMPQSRESTSTVGPAHGGCSERWVCKRRGCFIDMRLPSLFVGCVWHPRGRISATTGLRNGYVRGALYNWIVCSPLSEAGGDCYENQLEAASNDRSPGSSDGSS